MYCACKAKLFPKQILKKYQKPLPVQFGTAGKENEVADNHTFFNRESMSGFGVNSIHQVHPAFIVPYKINMKLPKRPTNRYGNVTRSMTKEKLIHKEKQDNSININSVPGKINTIKSNNMPPTAVNKEEVPSPRQGIKATATSAVKLGAVTAKLLTLKKKANPPPKK